MKTIVVACGAGAVSSALMSNALEELLRRRGVRAKIIRCRFDQVRQYQGQADLVVTAVTLPADLELPVVMGTPFLTGRGLPNLETQLLGYLA